MGKQARVGVVRRWAAVAMEVMGGWKVVARG